MRVQIRKLYESEIYLGAKILRFFNGMFGHDEIHMHSLCIVVDFQPNIHHTSKLEAST